MGLIEGNGMTLLCESCVYFNRNLDPSLFSTREYSQSACSLEFIPDDNKCAEMRTNNCGARKR
jgi:hypothetical protein